MTEHRYRNVLIILAVCAAILAPGGARSAPQEETTLITPVMFQYAVKYVCGKSEAPVVAPGAYYTAINVHNPWTKDVEFRKKFAIALPGEKQGPISKWFPTGLGPDGAYEIDCPDILKHLDTKGFTKGFVVIESRFELDVVAVYTAAGGTGRVETMDVETVKPRRIGDVPPGGVPDLIPVPDAAGNFCKRSGSKLTVTVKNQGTGAAGPSTTRVDFGSFGVQDQPTPALAPGASVDLTFTIPTGCFDPNCEFRIVVDFGGAVTESNEANNFASGTCLG